MRILSFIFLLSFTSFSQENNLLVIGNYSQVCFPDSTVQTVDSLPGSLDSIDVIMLFSGSTSSFSQKDLDSLESFVSRGGGLYLGSDNWPLQAESNQVTSRIYMKEGFGNYEQKNAEVVSQGNLNLDKEDTIPAGITTTAFPMDHRLRVEAWVKDQPLILTGTIGEGRIVIDGGYSRFYCAIRDENTDRLFEKILVFLRGGE